MNQPPRLRAGNFFYFWCCFFRLVTYNESRSSAVLLKPWRRPMSKMKKKNSGVFKSKVAFYLTTKLSGVVVTMTSNGLDVTLISDSGKPVTVHISYVLVACADGSYYDYWNVSCPDIKKQTVLYYYTDGNNDGMYKRIANAVIEMKESIANIV